MVGVNGDYFHLDQGTVQVQWTNRLPIENLAKVILFPPNNVISVSFGSDPVNGEGYIAGYLDYTIATLTLSQFSPP